jgi:uncharacterized peroxidase-related enzyme
MAYLCIGRHFRRNEMTNVTPQKSPSGKAQELLNAVQKKLGMVPNMMATMAHSPAVLESYLSFSGALTHASLPATLQEKIALAVSEENRCDYCVAAHTKLGSLLGISSAELTASRKAEVEDPRERAALTFARSIVRNRGKVTVQEIEDLRAVGYDDPAITEIVAVVALNIFTNYFNHVADPEIDFPRVD